MHSISMTSEQGQGQWQGRQKSVPLLVSKSAEMTEAEAGFVVGQRVAEGDHKGTVRFVGAVGDTPGEWVGVDWDDPGRGRHDGTHQGARYFQTAAPTSGSFVRPKKLSAGVSLGEAVRRRYGQVEGETAGVQRDVLDMLQKEMNAPFLEVVGFDKVNRRQSDFARLRVVAVRGNRVSGLRGDDVGRWMPQVRELNLAGNLLWSWAQVAEIGAQLSRLTALNLTANLIADEPDPGLLGRCLPNLTSLVLNEMGYTWAQALRVAAGLPGLRALHVASNRITELEAPPDGALAQLRELDLSRNRLPDWGQVLKLRALPGLEQLMVNCCGLTSIHFSGVEEGEPCFPSLRFLQLTENAVGDWASVASLHRLPTLEDVRIRLNPVLETENGETCRQLLIASNARLKVVNGTEVFKTERYGAELDYLKRYGLDYLSAAKEEGGGALAAFHARHPRYAAFVRTFGPPEEAELRRAEAAKNATLATNLLEVNLRVPASEGFPPTKKRLPPSLTVHKLRALLQRAVKVPGLRAHQLELSYVSGASDAEMPFDNELRDLAFYDIVSGDTIVIRWS